MTRKSLFQILPDYRLIIEYYSGEINLDDILNTKIMMTNDAKYDHKFSVIHDFRDARINIHESEIKRVEGFLSENTSIIDKRKGACITNNPHDVAITMLMSFVLNNFPVKVEIFSTIGSALWWLDITALTAEDIEKIIESLKNQIQRSIVE